MSPLSAARCYFEHIVLVEYHQLAAEMWNHARSEESADRLKFFGGLSSELLGDMQQVNAEKHTMLFGSEMDAAERMTCLQRGQKRYDRVCDEYNGWYQYDEVSNDWYPEETKRTRWVDGGLRWFNMTRQARSGYQESL